MPGVRQTGLFLLEQSAAHLGMFARFHEHTLTSALASAPRWPTPPLLIVINLAHRENKTRHSGTTGCYVCEGIRASLLPKICQRLPTAFRMKSKPFGRMTHPGQTLPNSHLPSRSSHPHPDQQAGLQGRFSNAWCPPSLPALHRLSGCPLRQSPVHLPPGLADAHWTLRAQRWCLLLQRAWPSLLAGLPSLPHKPLPAAISAPALRLLFWSILPRTLSSSFCVSSL